MLTVIWDQGHANSNHDIVNEKASCIKYCQEPGSMGTASSRPMGLPAAVTLSVEQLAAFSPFGAHIS